MSHTKMVQLVTQLQIYLMSRYDTIEKIMKNASSKIMSNLYFNLNILLNLIIILIIN